MGEIDKRGVLDDEIFSYRALKDGKVLIYWHEKHVTTLAGKAAREIPRAKSRGLTARLLSLSWRKRPAISSMATNGSYQHSANHSAFSE